MNLSIYIADEKLVKRLQAEADRKKRSLSYYVSEVLTDHLEWLDNPAKKALKENSIKRSK